MSKALLSTRQRTLVQRLEALCSRAQEEELPIIVDEVWGFGSFFRLKERPRDLDLGVKFSEFHPLWQEFTGHMEKAVSAKWTNTSHYSTPNDALRDVLLKNQEEMKLWPLFSKWVEGATWEAMARGIVPETAYNWDVVTRKLLTKGLPGAKIMSFAKTGEKFSLVTEAVTLIWSRAKPDVGSNLRAAFSPDSLRDSLIVELVGFDRQLSDARFELMVRTQLYKLLIRLPVKVFPPKDDYKAQHDWLVSKAKELVPTGESERVQELFERSLSVFWEKKTPAERPSDGASYRNRRLIELQEEAEKKRAELKESHRELEVLKTLADAVMDW